MDAIEKMYDNIMKEMDEYNEANKAAAQLTPEEMIKAIYDVVVGGADADEAEDADIEERTENESKNSGEYGEGFRGAIDGVYVQENIVHEISLKVF